MTVALAKGNQGLVWRTFPQGKKNLIFEEKSLVLNSKEVLFKKEILPESL